MSFSRHLAFAACGLAFFASPLPFARAEPSGVDAIPRSENYTLRSWDRQDGLPDIDLKGITQTPDGYLWVAGWNGLARFDGLQFTTIPESSGLKPTNATAVLCARDGTLWVGHGQGALSRLRGGVFEVAIPPSADPNASILSLVEDADGGIWAGFVTGGGAIRWKQGERANLRVSGGRGNNYLLLYSATNGVLWFTTAAECGFFDGRKFQPLPMPNRDGMHLGVARQGGMWAVRGQELLRLWDNGKSESIADLSWLGGSAQVTVLYEDREGNLWIGTRGVGLLRFRDGKFERAPTSFPWIQCLFEDRDGNLWVGTHGGGLNRLSPSNFFLRAAPVDPAANPWSPRESDVCSLTVDREGRLWMAQGHTLVRATDATNRAFELAPGWTGPNDILSLAFDSSWKLWMGGVQRKLRCWTDGKFLAEAPLPGPFASFQLGHRGQIWLSLKNPHAGVYEWSEGALTRLSESIGDPVCTALDNQGRLWVGANDGRVFYREGSRFLEAPMPDPQAGDMVSFLVPDETDTVWIGCVRSGLYRWRAGRIDKLAPDSGLPIRELAVLEIGSNGNFWFGTSQGLIRVPRAELEAVLDGRQSTLQTAAYGSNNGIPGTLGFHFGLLHPSARTPDGHLWFGTTLGALEVIPEDLRKAAQPDSVLIEDFLAGGKSLSLPKNGGAIALPPRPGTIQIRYTLPQLSEPEQIRFRHRLLGFDEDSWSASDSQRTATFTNLPPGSYTFEVAATDPASPSQSKMASVSFTVRAAWWETPWFQLGCLLMGAGILAALVREIVKRRMQARMRRLEQEHGLERERTRIARDMHDELGARLTHIILISELAAAKTPTPDLQRITRTARAVSSTLDQIVWMTNPRNDTLKQLINYIVEFAEEYLMDAKISLRSKLPEEVPDREISSEKRHHILLVVKEALNNIAKHAGARNVHLCISLASSELRITIRDDGRGFDPTAIAPTSNGLANMRQRLAALGGELKIESALGHGTRVMLAVNI